MPGAAGRWAEGEESEVGPEARAHRILKWSQLEPARTSFGGLQQSEHSGHHKQECEGCKACMCSNAAACTHSPGQLHLP